MAFLIGTDEAGYGPNLGPLTVGGTLWQVPDEVLDDEGRCDLYRLLQKAVRPPGKQSASSKKSLAKVIASPTTIASPNPLRIPIGDSKALFTSRGSLAQLEHSVLTMLRACDQPYDDFFELLDSVSGLKAIQLAGETTYDWSQRTLPIDAELESIQGATENVVQQFEETGIHCLRIGCTLLFPEDFNQGMQRCGNKASLLSIVTCQLVKRLLATIDASTENQKVFVMCDKHGGRAHYAGLLQQEMTDSFVQVVRETRQESLYRWSDNDGDVTIRFIAKGESEMPIALASMIAKYLRELSMAAWNRFWQQRMPELIPTAGYPQDAKRYKKDIQSLQKKLNVEDRVIWREK